MSSDRLPESPLEPPSARMGLQKNLCTQHGIIIKTSIEVAVGTASQ
jgi:hypothetical protein